MGLRCSGLGHGVIGHRVHRSPPASIAGHRGPRRWRLGEIGEHDVQEHHARDENIEVPFTCQICSTHRISCSLAWRPAKAVVVAETPGPSDVDRWFCVKVTLYARNSALRHISMKGRTERGACKGTIGRIWMIDPDAS